MLKGVLLSLTCVVIGCNRYDTTKFDLPDNSGRFAPHITLVENEDLRITVGNIYASYPDGRYEFGINTEVGVANLGSQIIVLDSVMCRQYYRSLELSDSIHVEGESQSWDSLPITLCPAAEGISCSLARLTFYTTCSSGPIAGRFPLVSSSAVVGYGPLNSTVRAPTNWERPSVFRLLYATSYKLRWLQ
jgi:hypothetical protein